MSTKKCLLTALAVVSCTLLPLVAFAVPGDVLTTITVPVPTPSCCGVSIAVDCDGVLYYTNSFSPTLYKMDKTGMLLGSVPIVDAATGGPLSIGALSWDGSSKMLWGGTDTGCPPQGYLIDPATGLATYKFTVVSQTFCFIDGIAYDGNDNTVWISDDVSSAIDHFDASGVYLGSLTPLDAAGNVLGAISGVLVGTGNKLYLGRNGFGQIVRVDKTTGAFIDMFATVAGRDEDLECDVINFAPLTAVWSKDTYNNTVTALEVESGTCACEGGALEVVIDIKPTSCPNPLNVKNMGLAEDPDFLFAHRAGIGPKGDNGVLPIAILGTADFDVADVDPTTVMLQGVVPLRWAFEDVATPVVEDPDRDCECTTRGADGYMDMTLKFRQSEIIMAIGAVTDGQYVPLTLTGMLYDGTEIVGSDCVLIRAKLTLDGVVDPGFEPEALSNHPNPFNAATTIRYSLSTEGSVQLVVYNVLGQQVATLVDGLETPGEHSVTWDGRNGSGAVVPSGMYFYRLDLNGQSTIRSMTLLK